jgi:DNA-binding HxlR family transcriptional regulator
MADTATTQRPIMALLDILGRRWTLRILWELRDGPLSFGDLQERCDGMSPSVLSQRLSELRKAAILEAAEGGRYRVTTKAEALGEMLLEMNDWAKTWGRRR